MYSITWLRYQQRATSNLDWSSELNEVFYRAIYGLAN